MADPSTATPRDAPHVWVTWLSRLLEGPVCPWAYWFRANHYLRSEEPPSPDRPMWMARHESIVEGVVAEIRERGIEPELELDLSVVFPDGVGLAGRADVVATNVDRGTIDIYEVKGGQPRPSDAIQLLTYMWLQDATLEEGEEWSIGGYVVRRNGRERFDGLPEGFEDSLFEGLSVLTSTTPPPRVPGRDCLFCPITRADCPDRID